ncbi:MAG TPA: M23 family metallopeptidase [Kofleriaceae bacterium]|jgi:murein DD-endopeptidase MepM/ murein hydrolase activator NlpD
MAREMHRLPRMNLLVLLAPLLTVAPAALHPGDAGLVTVRDVATAPTAAKAGGQRLACFPTAKGYEALFAVPLDVNEDHILVEDAGTEPVTVPIAAKHFADTSVIVEDELANPPAADRATIDADNAAITAAYAKANGAPQFKHAFKRPPGAVTSPFGEWRTFNDGHRSQHLGLDLLAREGSPVAAVNDGTVALVRSTFLAGNVVVIAHGGGISSLYFHLSKTGVAEGDVIARGQVIGRAGHTGRTTGPHLHVSIHVPGGMVDPAQFFALPIAPSPLSTASR